MLQEGTKWMFSNLYVTFILTHIRVSKFFFFGGICFFYIDVVEVNESQLIKRKITPTLLWMIINQILVIEHGSWTFGVVTKKAIWCYTMCHLISGNNLCCVTFKNHKTCWKCVQLHPGSPTKQQFWLMLLYEVFTTCTRCLNNGGLWGRMS